LCLRDALPFFFMITFAVGISSEHDSFKAGKDAAKDALSRLGGKALVGGLVFASVALDQDQFLSEQHHFFL
jgi:hypothetical protein